MKANTTTHTNRAPTTPHRRGWAWPVHALCVAVILMTGSCVMKEATMQAPRQQARITVAPGTTTTQVFACAERELQALAVEDGTWLGEVTRRDLTQATLESGDYNNEDITGFRVRLQHVVASNTIEIEAKGAGAYFVDLGVDAAIQTFRQRLERCLAGGA